MLERLSTKIYINKGPRVKYFFTLVKEYFRNLKEIFLKISQ